MRDHDLAECPGTRLSLQHHESLTALIPNSMLVAMEQSGHFPLLGEPEYFAAVVDEFLH
jgi:pimeloyl-ACP methyl ester carboxylesterase